MKSIFIGAFALMAWGLPATSRAADAPDNTNADSAAGRMKAELNQVGKVVSASNKPEDLDAVLGELQKYQGGADQGEYTREDRALLQQLNGALEFVKTWQNYLLHVNSGQADLARNDLSSLSQNNAGFGFIPRSRILALEAGMTKLPTPEHGTGLTPESTDVQKILDGIDTLDGLEPALKQLYALGAENQVAQSTAKALAPLVEVYGDLKAGLPTSVNLTFMGGTTGPGVSAKTNALLLNFILEHYFDTYAGPPPADGETPPAYTARVKAAAMAAQDWTLLKKALVAHESLIRCVSDVGGSPSADHEAAGLNRMVDGINQETAGQYALAVVSYQYALKSGSFDIPAKMIGKRLDGIKQEHPTDYDTGMTTFLSFEAPYFPGMMQQTYHPPGPQNASPVISIPAAKTNAAPATNAPPAKP